MRHLVLAITLALAGVPLAAVAEGGFAGTRPMARPAAIARVAALRPALDPGRPAAQPPSLRPPSLRPPSRPPGLAACVPRPLSDPDPACPCGPAPPACASPS
ncbi:MAG: hypothetical protein IT542_14360 [Rubellimicrobium sp.]|nr:hypothetical protein [Rubellimicrobium sp.]